MRPRRAKTLISAGLVLVVAACLFHFFAPTALGGSATYVVTDGVSMEPRFHAGDLAVVRSQGSYHVGEIVAYRSVALHTIVLHRIIGREGADYVFKGDNNNFIDIEHPAPGQLLGALWMHLPGAGATMESLRSPLAVGVLVGLGALLLLGAGFANTRRRRGRARRSGDAAPRSPSPPTPSFAAALIPGIVVACAIVLIPAVMLALLAFTHPVKTTKPYAIAYQQSGRLSYTAVTSPSPAYPKGRLVTGDPVFTRLIGAVLVRFGYTFRAPVAHTLAGTMTLQANVNSTTGWQQTIQLAPPLTFHGDHAALVAPLDVRSILATIAALEKDTGVTGAYTMTIAPQVAVSGTVGAQPLRTAFQPASPTVAVVVPVHASFAPTLHFNLTQFEAQPVIAGSALTTGPHLPANVAAPASYGSVSTITSKPGYLSFGLFSVRVADARWIALLAIAVVMALLIFATVVARERSSDESAEIVARYGRWLVPVARVWQEPGVAVIDVNDIQALVRIAERYDRAILHEHDEIEGDAFWVTDESGQYRYAVAPSRPREETPVPAVVDADTEEYSE